MSQLTLETVRSSLSGVRPAGGGWVARCPAHDDKQQSLSIGQGRDGKVLLRCHAGCDFTSIVRAMNVTPSQLFPERTSNQPSPIEATYDYTDEDGVLLYQAVRKVGKEFAQRKPDGKGGWIWKLEGVRPVPFRLPELIEDMAVDRTVYIVEGEKDVNNLRALGFTATTNSGGAGKWKDEFAPIFKGAKVVILPDNDEPGRKHAAHVERSLTGFASSIKVLALPGLPEKGDVSDWIAAGGDATRLISLTNAPPLEQRKALTRFQLLDLDEMARQPEPQWLIDKAFPEAGTAAIIGPTKEYKTFCAVDVASCVSLGMDWHGRHTRAGQVAFIAGEGASGIRKRFNAWAEYHRIQPPVLVLPHSMDFGTAEDVEQLVAAVRSRIPEGRLSLLIVDTLNRNMIGDENSSEYVAQYLAACQRIQDELGATVLTIHHSGYATGGETGKKPRPRGSSAFEAGMDTMFLCTRTNGGDRVELRCDKQKDGIDGWTVEFEVLQYAQSLVLKPSGVSSQKLTGQRLQALLALHRIGVDGATSTDWHDASDIEGDSSFQKARKWLKDGAYVKQTGKRYIVTEQGRMAVQAHTSTTSTTTPPILHSATLQLPPLSGGSLDPLSGVVEQGNAGNRSTPEWAA